MTDTPLSKDLESLRHLELPGDGPQSHLVRTSVLLITIAIACAVAGLIFSVVVLSKDKNDLENQLTCLRDSSIQYDKSIGEGIKLLVDLKLADTNLLVGLSDDNPEQVEAAIRSLARQTSQGAIVQVNIDRAVQARENAVQNCR